MISLKNKKFSEFFSGKVIKFWHGLIISCSLLMLLSSCATMRHPPVPKPLIIAQVLKVTPPPALIAATPAPSFQGRLNDDLKKWALDSQDALGACNADKAQLRAWVAGAK